MPPMDYLKALERKYKADVYKTKKVYYGMTQRDRTYELLLDELEVDAVYTMNGYGYATKSVLDLDFPKRCRMNPSYKHLRPRYTVGQPTIDEVIPEPSNPVNPE